MKLRVALMVALGTACGGDGGGGDGAGDGGGADTGESWPGAVTWRWTFSDGGGCPADVASVRLYLRAFQVTSAMYYDTPQVMATVPCADGMGSFTLAEPTTQRGYGYQTYIELVTTDGRSFAYGDVHDTRGGDASPETTIQVPRGWVHVAWALEGRTSGSPVACDAITTLDGTMIGLSVQGQGARHAVRCTDGETWLGLPPGAHTLYVDALRSLRTDVVEPDRDRVGRVELGASVTAGATLELGTIAIPIDGL